MVSSELDLWPAALEFVAVGDFLVLAFFPCFPRVFYQSSSGVRLRRHMSQARSGFQSKNMYNVVSLAPLPWMHHCSITPIDHRFLGPAALDLRQPVINTNVNIACYAS